MAILVHSGTYVAPFSGNAPDVHGMSFDSNSGDLWALAGFGPTARLVDFDFSGANPSFTSNTVIGGAFDGFQVADYGAFQLDLSADILSRLSQTSSTVQDSFSLSSGNSGLATDEISAVTIDFGGTEILVTTRPGYDGLATFSRANDGTLTHASTQASPAIGPISDVAAIQAYGKTWILATSHNSDAVQSFHVDANGDLSHQATYGAIEGLGINNPTEIATTMLGGQPHILVASDQSNSLSVIRLEADGSFSATDHILDDLDTRFADASSVEVIETSDATYAVASGSDDGFSLFQLHQNGTLSHLGSVEDTNATTLDNISAISLTEQAGILRILLASDLEIGLSQFNFDITNVGQEVTGTAGDDLLVGTNLDDVILAGAGDDIIDGGGGTDRIRDGDGTDRLTGGAGADIFVVVLDAHTDRIEDFERGVDGLDLTFYPLLHAMDQVGVTQTSWGIQLDLRGDILEIHSSDGNPLSLADITAIDPFQIDRPPLILSPGGSGAGGAHIQIGTEASNLLVGSASDDILSGNGGDDILIGGAGGDQLLGGAGFDTASYASSSSGLTIDLATPSANSGDASGDSYGAIEAIEGSGFADHIGGNSTYNRLVGGAGDDHLLGRAGNDILLGGSGDDWLWGGTGADQLFGGAGSDWVGYDDATTGLRADLGQANRNSGIAEGDTYDEVENIFGSAFDDHLYGDQNDNQIDGRSGDDWISGNDGDDMLSGGNGDDVLMGGNGADLLDGGSGFDRADYVNSKSAVIADLANDSANAGGAAGDQFVSIEALSGSAHDDTLFGDTNANSLFGNRGDDLLVGGGGDDWFLGGQGQDRYQFGLGHGRDHVADFDIGSDILVLEAGLLGTAPVNAASVLSTFATDLGDDILLDFGSGNSILLEDVENTDDLTDNFEFF